MITRSGEDAYFELAFSPCVSLVSIVRRFVSEFYSEILGDADVTSRIALATHELLENGARYSIDGQASVRIDVKREAGAIGISITTRNRAAKENIGTIKAAIDEMGAAKDAQAHYQVLMRRSLKRKDGSGLGLGRVHAESEMALTYEIEDDVVMLRAHTRVEPRRAP
jgi:anti-sigma regulatory factor (Ser/Thr protein kinase)